MNKEIDDPIYKRIIKLMHDAYTLSEDINKEPDRYPKDSGLWDLSWRIEEVGDSLGYALEKRKEMIGEQEND